MSKLTTEDLHNLTRQVEEIEKTGGEAFALTSFTPAMHIPVEAVDFDPWGELNEGSAEEIPVTREALESFARHALTRHKGSAEVVPAREFLAELAAKLGA